MAKRELELDLTEPTAQGRKMVDEVRTLGDKDEVAPGCLTRFIKNPEMIQVLLQKGVKELFPIQYMSFNLLYAGEDLLGKDRTGSGKTLAFSLPIIERMRAEKAFQQSRSPKFLIVLPTRELTLQVCNEIKSLRLHSREFTVVAVYGGSDMRTQCNEVRSGADIIVATPGRLMDLIEKGVIRFDSLKVVCLDEADEMLNQGFHKDIEKIFQSIRREAPSKTQNLMFSATIPQWVRSISEQYQRNCKVVDLINKSQTAASKTVKHFCMKLDYDDNVARVVRQLISKFAKEDGRVLVFCETKRETDRIGRKMKDEGIRCEMLHGDVSQTSREYTYKRFKEGSVRCVVATNVAARGLDFPCIELVIQTSPPKQIESYIHRSGRTGRINRNGIAVTLFDSSTERAIYRIQSTSKIRMEYLHKSDLVAETSMFKTDRPLDLSHIPKPHATIDEHRHEELKYDRNQPRKPYEVAKKGNFDEHELFISGLSSSTTESDVEEMFQKKRVSIRRVTILKDSDRHSKGCGFVSFRDERSMEEGLRLSNIELKGNSIKIRTKR